jgi:LacI family transcriptional regulator
VRVSSQTRERILALARELGYRPNALARSLVRGRTHTIGVLYPHGNPLSHASPWSAGVLEGVAEAAIATGYNVALLTAPLGGGEEIAARSILDGRLDGVLLVAPPLNHPLLERLASHDFPTVLLSNRQVAGPRMAYVDLDQYAMGVTLTEHLIGLGHRRLAHLTATPVTHSGVERARGFRDALVRHGIPLREEWVAPNCFFREPAAAAFQRFWSVPERPSAVFAGNETGMLGVLDAARELGVRIPEHLSLAAVDGTILSTVTAPPITVVEQPILEMGRVGMRLLTQIIAGEDVENVVLPAPLVVRASTAAPLW